MNGDNATYAKTFIQILELTEHTQKSDWPIHLKPVLSRFNLKPIKNSDSEYSGTTNRSGTYQNIFAAPIRVKKHDHMILFVTTTGNEEDKPSTAEKKAILDELKALETVFN